MTNKSLKTLEVKLLELGESQFQQFIKHKNAAMQTINASVSWPFRDMLNNTADHSTLYGTLITLKNRTAPSEVQAALSDGSKTRDRIT